MKHRKSIEKRLAVLDDMEFTPKKQTISRFDNGRRTPYSSGGQTHYKRFNKRINQSASPRIRYLNQPGSPRPRCINQSGSPRIPYTGSSSQTYPQKRFVSRSERLVNLSTKLTHVDDVTPPEKRISKGSPSPKSTKRPFIAVNNVESVKGPFPSFSSNRDADTPHSAKRLFKTDGCVKVSSSHPGDRGTDTFDGKKKHNDENDPYNFCSSLDTDISDKRTNSDIDKQNSIFPRTSGVKSYPSKKKQIDVSRSRLLADISPDKVEKAYGSNFKFKAEKENVPAETTRELMVSPESSSKRPFIAVNSEECVKVSSSHPGDRGTDTFDGKKKHNDENDPYNFCSSLDTDISDKRTNSDIDKQNSIFPRTSGVKSYPSKKKQVDISRSRLVADISPDKLEKAYGSSYKFEAEKENVPALTTTTTAGEVMTSPEPCTTLPHLIGFPNYGNTCYLNSVVQALFGLSPFVGDLQMVSSQLNLPTTSLSSGLSQVIAAHNKGQVAMVKQSLKTVKENLVRVDGSFSGYKMQDANEFLTRILDTIKDEIDRCHMTTPSPDRSLTSKDEDLDEIFPYSTKCQKLMSKRVNNCDSEISIHSKDNSFTSSRKLVDQMETAQETPEVEETSLGERVLLEADGESEHVQLCPSQSVTPNKLCDEETLPRNPIKDNFEFQLFESYRCLGCNEVEGKKQEYFGLYVNLTEENHESIQDAVSSCMGEDERELKCEKCGHNRSSVVTAITRLPRILIVQLKRYEYNADQGETIKRSWRVPVTCWLSLDEYVTDVPSPSLWSPRSGRHSVTPRASKQTTLTVRNLSSELNVCEGRKEQEELPVCSPGLLPTPTENVIPLPSSDKEDEELQEVMRRSMDDIGGAREEDEIQQAIRLSLQDLGMSYTHENQTQTNEEQVEKEESHKPHTPEEEVDNHRHTFRLISVISHFGCTTNTGHYVADVYNCEEKSWFHYDDETVSKIPESVVLAEGRQKNGYIFFYVHKDVFQEIEKKANLHR